MLINSATVKVKWIVPTSLCVATRKSFDEFSRVRSNSQNGLTAIPAALAETHCQTEFVGWDQRQSRTTICAIIDSTRARPRGAKIKTRTGDQPSRGRILVVRRLVRS